MNNQVQVPKKGSVDSVITNAKIGLRKMKIQFPEKWIIAHLNINSIRKILFPSWLKILHTYYLFQKLNWVIHFHQFNLKYVDLVCLCSDRDSMGGRLLLYIRDDIPTKLLKHDFGPNIEILSVKRKFTKGKVVFQWLLQSA